MLQLIAYFNLASASGIPNDISLSNLPARLSAGSNESGLFVAPKTSTWPACFRFKSNNNNNVDLTKECYNLIKWQQIVNNYILSATLKS